MDHDGLSSLAVVDNHSNVVGNISTTDVKVGRHFIHDGSPGADRIAPYSIIVAPSATEHVHAFHLCDSVHARFD